MGVIENFKSLPVSAKRLLGIGVVLALVVALPLFIWAIITQKFLISKRAASGEPTPAPRVSIDIAGQPSVGPENAPILIVEFGDFECPFCKTFHDQTFGALMQAYPNQIHFVFKDFPLIPIHPQAQVAAEAAECAFEQDKFWEMHDMIFDNQDTLSNSSYAGFAAQLNLNVTQFNDCTSTHKYAAEIANDYTQGISYGVGGTPTFFINGLVLVGAAPLSVFQDMINQELASLPPSPPPTTYPESVVTPTSAPAAPGEPNACGGTCGSNYNCKANLYCYQGHCRNPDCRTSTNCSCVTSSPTAKPKSTFKPGSTATPISEVVYLSPRPYSTPYAISTAEPTETPSIAVSEQKKPNLSFLLWIAGGSLLTALILLGINSASKKP